MPVAKLGGGELRRSLEIILTLLNGHGYYAVSNPLKAKGNKNAFIQSMKAFFVFTKYCRSLIVLAQGDN